MDSREDQVWWIDINDKKLFCAANNGSDMLVTNLDAYPGAILDVDEQQVLICCDLGILRVDRKHGRQEILARMPEEVSSTGMRMRANDGVKDSSGVMWFGTMEWEPTGRNGALYSYDGSSIVLKATKIGIPNLFVELENGDLLVADSYEKIVYRFRRDESGVNLGKPAVWRDFSEEKFTPDGGCIDASGRVYIAFWDGFSVGVYDSDGTYIENMCLPVPRPTNCKVGPDGRLFITSAQVGLSLDEKAEFPLSGSVFVVEREAFGA